MLCSYKLSLHASLGYASFQHRDRTLHFCTSFYLTVLSGFQPNYAINRDLRGNTGFKFYTGRVGPLFWLLGAMTHNSKQGAHNAVAIINDILLYKWDPIGISHEPACHDEYLSYAIEIYSFLARGESPDFVARHLDSISSHRMGLGANHTHSLEIANKLIALWPSLHDRSDA